MLKKTIEYTDYNGTERKETHWFNLTEAELTEMELEHDGGLANYITRISEEQSGPKIIKIFKDIILRAYGVKSDDGRRFIKSEELKEEFKQTEAYSILFMELATNAEKAAEFINGIIPKNLGSKVDPKALHPAVNK